MQELGRRRTRVRELQDAYVACCKANEPEIEQLTAWAAVTDARNQFFQLREDLKEGK